MTREYLFRGIREDNGEWVTGDLSHTNQGKPVIQKWIIGNDGRNELLYYVVKPETIGQYIGLKDNTGELIYEGDIVQGINGKLWIIKWKEYAWWVDNKEIIDSGRNKLGGTEAYTVARYFYLVKSAHTVTKPSDSELLTIKGNLFQNPELLKKD